MKKLLLAIFAAAMTTAASAQVNGNGYYRVTNLGRQVVNKQNCYVYVDYNQAQIVTNAGTGQSFEPIAIYQDTKRSPISDPASVIYAKLNGNNVDLEAQGTSVSQMTSQKLILTQNGKANSYQLSTIKSGMTMYLWASTTPQFEHYIATTIASDQMAYKFWAISPVSSSSDNYFGVKPTLSAEGKYYAPFYAAFPFKFASSGMKAYCVKNFDNEHFALEEITSEVKPGKTPMLIECSSENPSDNRLDLLYGNYGSVSGNKLSGVFFCNDFISGYSDVRTQFDAAKMRVWNVENGKLVLSTSEDNLFKSIFASDAGKSFIRANQSYLVVPATANKTLTVGVPSAVDGINASEEAPEPVSYSTLGGMKIDAPEAGMGVVVVKYSDGTARKVVY